MPICPARVWFGLARSLFSRQTTGQSWMIWPAGDFPDNLLEASRQILAATERGVRCNGLMQGLIGLQLDRASRNPSPPPA